MMRAAAMRAALLAVLTVPGAGTAQAQVALGRLFSSPDERAAMEATRGASAALLPNSQGQPPAAAAQAGVPGGAAPTPGGGPIVIPNGGTMEAAMAGAGAMAGAAPMPGQPAATPQAGPAQAGPPPAPPGLTMSGVLRSSDNRTTVWLNDLPQTGLQHKLSRGAGSPSLTVTLPSGKKIQLKAGQRYDLTEDRIKDVNEP